MTERNCSGVSRAGRHRGADAGVVDQDVDPAECRHRRVDEVLAGLRVGHVGAHRDRAAAHALDEGGRLGELVLAPGAEGDVGARLGERLGEDHAQPARGAGDDGDLAVEPEQVEDCHVSPFERVGEPDRAHRVEVLLGEVREHDQVLQLTGPVPEVVAQEGLAGEAQARGTCRWCAPGSAGTSTTTFTRPSRTAEVSACSAS